MPEASPHHGESITVAFQPLGRRVHVRTGTSLLDAAREAGIALLSVCGGTGLCETCRVRVVRGDVAPPTAIERDRLDAEQQAAGYRLACQAIARGDSVVDVPVESIGADQRLQLEWVGLEPGRQDGAFAAEPGLTGLGLALDIGTTKIAAYLVDRASGRTLAAEGAMNPQIAHGEDVISRIAFADKTENGAATLHAMAIDCVNRLTMAMCATIGASPDDVVDAVIVGNTVMHHLAAGLPIASLGRAPYAPAVTGALSLAARDIGLRAAGQARVYLPPNLAGYVGADHVAMLTAIGLAESAGAGEGPTRLAIDIGTNTEVSLIAGRRIFSCSCASGPAFEGAHIGCGMRAAPGAIERVRVVEGRVRCRVIGDVPPIGVCGSGVLDAVAELASHGALDRHGGFRKPHELLSARGSEPIFLLAPAAVTGHNRDLALTRRDVSEIQLAKAAIRTGIDLLLAQAGARESDLDEVIVAGAFGSYIDLASARRVGLLPDRPPRCFRQVGNAAGAGARAMLLSSRCRQEAERLAARIVHLDLTAHPRFTEVFAAALGFAIS